MEENLNVIEVRKERLDWPKQYGMDYLFSPKASYKKKCDQFHDKKSPVVGLDKSRTRECCTSDKSRSYGVFSRPKSLVRKER